LLPACGAAREDFVGNMEKGLAEELEPWETLLVQKHFPTPPLNDLVRLPGDLLMPRTLLPLLQRIQELPLRSDDVWVVSYPKCGTTWTQEMVWMILNDLDMEKGQLPLVIRSPFLEFGCIQPSTDDQPQILTGGDPLSGEVDQLLSSFLADPIEFTSGLSGRRRVIKTHLPLAFLPPHLLTTCKVILVTRNVRDCAVSYFHHNLNITPHDFIGDFTSFAKMFKLGLVYNGSYWGHQRSFEKAEGILRLRFEEMKEDQKSAIHQVCHFLDVQLSEEKVECLLKHLAFDNMKKNPAVNPFASAVKPKDLRGHFVREGKVGNWVNYFPQDLDKEWTDWEDEEKRKS